MRNTDILVLVLKSIPYSNQITDIDLREYGVARFTWRGDRFRVNQNLMVEQVIGGMLESNNTAMLLEKLLQYARKG